MKYSSISYEVYQLHGRYIPIAAHKSFGVKTGYSLITKDKQNSPALIPYNLQRLSQFSIDEILEVSFSSSNQALDFIIFYTDTLKSADPQSMTLVREVTEQELQG